MNTKSIDVKEIKVGVIIKIEEELKKSGYVKENREKKLL